MNDSSLLIENQTQECIPFAVFNIAGNNIVSGTLNAGSNSIDTHNLTTGIYVLIAKKQAFKFCKAIN